MCRWLAYQGPTLALDALLIHPENALVRQALAARHGVTPVNGDGFGLAWWGDKPEPGLFRDTLLSRVGSGVSPMSGKAAAKACSGACCMSS
mgnify:FL=1